VLSAAAIATAGLGESADWDILWAYQGVVLAIAVGLSVDLVRSRWADATLTGLVVELGDVRDERFLRERLASTLRDPSLAVGYLSPGQQGFVDEDGHRLALPESAAERLVTIVRDEGEPVAAIVHHPGSLADPKLADSVSDAVRIAVSNVRLQREIRRQVDDLEASRRRLVEAGDRERRRLERALHTGAAARLERMERALTGAERDGGDPAALAAALAELGAARAELGELAQGIHPSRLTEHGLEQALTELARRAPIPVVLQIEARRSTAAVETAAYFICSEALANIGKHADASTATIDVRELGDRLIVEVRDDGPGGATLAGGSGLRGLADRVETLDGRFTVESRPGEGTVIVAEFPGGS
jgi:signal transduction histidine kinase